MDRSRRIAPKADLPVMEAWSMSSIKNLQKPSTTSPYNNSEGGERIVDDKTPYVKCKCCPYGYHIDIDFVRYCESMANEKYVRRLKQLHQDRRKQRKSMEILLGHRHDDYHGFRTYIKEEENGAGEIGKHAPPDVVHAAGDPLQNAVEDFEEAYRVSTLERKYHRHPVDLLMNTVSGLSMSMSSSSDSDTCVLLNGDECELVPGRCRSDSISSLSTISNCTDHHQLYTNPPSSHMANTLAALNSNSADPFSNLGSVSPAVLHTIREQMALSLQRMKELEEQAKAVPVLQVKLSVLKEEKRLLLLQLKAKEEFPKSLPPPPPRRIRSIGVNCAALMRDVSVNHVHVTTKDTAVDARPIIITCEKCVKAENSKKNLSVDVVGVVQIEPHPCKSCRDRNSRIFKTTSTLTEDNKVSKGTVTDATNHRSTRAVQAVPSCQAVQSQTINDLKSEKPDTKDSRVGTEKPDQRNFGCNFSPDVIQRGVGDESVFEKLPSLQTIGVGCGRIDNKLLCDSCTFRQVKSVATDTINLLMLHNVGCGLDVKFQENEPDLCNKCHQSIEDAPEREDNSAVSHVNLVVDDNSFCGSSDDSSEDESSSPDEASYDGLHGTITHSCGDDEAIREGRPGAVMFLPQPKLELNDSMRKNFKHLSDYLEIEGRLPSETANDVMKSVKEEWFKVSSQKDSLGSLVEEWLDSMENASPRLLNLIVNLSDSSGNTALHYAISHSNFDVVSLLLDSKVCNINHSNKAGYNCIMLSSLVVARENIHFSVIKRLFKLGDVNAKAAEHGQTALMLAASHGKLDMVRVLHEAGADINIQDADGSTALMCASEHGHLPVIRYLLAQPECDPNLVDNDNCNALSIAVEAGHKDVGLLIYAHTNFSRGSSPCSSIRSKKSTSSNRPPSRPASSSPSATPPYSPAKTRKSTSSIH